VEPALHEVQLQPAILEPEAVPLSLRHIDHARQDGAAFAPREDPCRESELVVEAEVPRFTRFEEALAVGVERPAELARREPGFPIARGQLRRVVERKVGFEAAFGRVLQQWFRLQVYFPRLLRGDAIRTRLGVAALAVRDGTVELRELRLLLTRRRL